MIRLLFYNRVEIFFAVSFIVMQANGGIWPVALWSGFVLCVWWVLMTSHPYSQVHAKDMVRHGTMQVQDTLVGGLMLMLLAYLVRAESWQFPVMFLVTAAQHFRYTCLTIMWKSDINCKHD